ncbi:MAG: carbonic anhydrase, partial [Candidatus Cybelea sp.]
MISSATPAEALERLKAGNARFMAGTPEHEPYGPRVSEFSGDQKPFAVILACSDSRLPVETLFDQLPGKIFVVRVAGNFVSDDTLGSIEFGVDALKAKLIVVLGHSQCGAVKAALRYVRDGIEQPGHVQQIVQKVAPAVLAARGFPGDWLDNGTVQNVALNVQAVTANSEIIAARVNAGEAKVIGGIYNVHT